MRKIMTNGISVFLLSAGIFFLGFTIAGCINQPLGQGSMSWLEFVSSMTGSLAWPISAAACIYGLRSPLSAVLNRVRKISAGGVDIDVKDALEATENLATTLPKDPPPPLELERQTDAQAASLEDPVELAHPPIANTAISEVDASAVAEPISADRSAEVSVPNSKKIDPSQVVHKTDNEPLSPGQAKMLAKALGQFSTSMREMSNKDLFARTTRMTAAKQTSTSTSPRAIVVSKWLELLTVARSVYAKYSGDSKRHLAIPALFNALEEIQFISATEHKILNQLRDIRRSTMSKDELSPSEALRFSSIADKLLERWRLFV